MINDLENSKYLKSIINSEVLGFIPTKFWQRRQLSVLDFINILTNQPTKETQNFQQMKQQFSKFNHRLWCILQITFADEIFFNFFGARWKTNDDLIIEVDSSIFSKYFESQSEESLISLFQSNGWQNINNNDSKNILFTFDYEKCLNIDLFDVEFYEQLVKYREGCSIQKLSVLLSKSLLFLIQSEKIEKSINYVPKSCEIITLEQDFYDDSLLTDVVHFVTFPGEIKFDKNQENQQNVEKIFKKIGKEQLLFDKSSFDMNYNGLKVILELPPSIHYPLFPKSDEFIQSVAIISSLLILSNEFKKSFFENCVESSQKVDSNKCFFEFISVLLILLKSHQFDLKSYNPIFMSLLFDDHATVYNYDSVDYQKILFLREQWIYFAFGYNENMMSICQKKFSFYKEIFQSFRKHPIGFSEFTLIVSQKFKDMSIESQNCLMLLMAQANVYYFVCLKSILMNISTNNNLSSINDDELNKYFYYQQMMNVMKLNDFNCIAQFNLNYNKLDVEDKKKVSAIIQARFSILTFFYKNFNEIFKSGNEQPFNAYQYKTFKLLLSSIFEISLQNQILSLINSKEDFYFNSNQEKDFSFFDQFAQIYFKAFNKKANDIITVTFCDNLIKYLHDKIYRILSKQYDENSKENCWINFLFEIFPNVIYWYSVIDNSFIPIDIIQLSICNAISFLTTCLSLSSIQKNNHLHGQFVKMFDSLYDELENVCLFYFTNTKIYCDLLFKNLLNLAAEKELNSIYNHFTIKLGKPIKILIKLFFNESTFSYLNNICFMDIRNCFQMAENGVDVLLIEYLYNNRNNRQSNELIHSITKLIKTISYQHSTITFVQKFISILTPINGTFLPYYLPLFVNILDELAMKENRFPLMSIPLLQEQSNLNVYNIDSELINNGVTFSFWIFINDTFTSPRKLLTIRQKREIKDKKIIVAINPNRKFSLIVSDEEDLMGPTKEQISEGKWHFIMISFKYRKKDFKIRIQSNDSLLYDHNNDNNNFINSIVNSYEDEMKSVVLAKLESGDFSQFFDFPKFDESQKVQLFIGSEDDSSYFNNNNEAILSHIQSDNLIKNYSNSILLGPIGMFPLLKEDSQYFYQMLNSITETPSKSIFYVYPIALNDEIVTFNFESNQFNSVSFPIQFKFNNSFVNVLIQNKLTEKLIILFGLNDLREKSNTIKIKSSDKSYIFDEIDDDHFYFDYTNAAIEIFRNIFSINENAQFDVTKINCFHIILHLLSTQFDDTIKINEMINKALHSISLDFFLYKNFVSLFESITIKSLQHQILNDVLFNFELWIKSRDIDLILNHWCTSLLPDFNNELFNKYSVISMLTLMRVYLYYEPIEKSIIKNDRKIDIEKVKTCRKLFWSIISSSNNIDQVEISTIVSHATTCPDFRHVEEMITFLSEFFDMKAKFQLNEDNSNSIQEIQPKKKLLKLFQDLSTNKNLFNSPAQANKPNNLDLPDYNSILQLNLLISCKYLEIVKKIIVLFIKLHQMQLVNEISFADHFDYICMDLPLFENPDEFLNELLVYFCPEIWSLCIIVALQANKDESLIKVINAVETFEQPEKLCGSKTWFLWPVISIFIRPSLYEKIIDFLVKCPNTEWSSIYNSMLICGYLLNMNARKFVLYFLTTISTNLCDNYDDSKADSFFNIVFYFLFVRLNTEELKFDGSLNTREIFKRIISLKQFYQSRAFEIEVDNNGCLIEANIIQIVLGLFERKHSKSYSDFIVILSAHQLPFENNPLDRFKKFNCITKSDAFYYYDGIAYSLNKDMLTKEEPQKIYINQAEYKMQFLNKYKSFFSTLDTNDFLVKLQLNLFEIDDKFKMYMNEKFKNVSTDLVRCYIDHFEMIKKSYKKQWESFWLSNSKEKDSIFHFEIQTDNLHFKRDNSNCYIYCPFKLIKNKNFNDHLKASLFRESGNITKAEIQYQQIKAEQKKKTSQNHELFTIEFDNDQNDKKNEVKEIEFKTDEKIVFQTNECERRKPNKRYFVNFVIFKDKIQIGKRIVLFDDINSVLLRNVRQHQTAIEILQSNGKSYFLNFPNLKNSFTIVSKIQQTIQLDNPKMSLKSKLIDFQTTCSNQFFFESKSYTQKWVNNEISNFEYLMIINIYSGRTFNDGMFYPVMPWIIQDYDSNELDLNDSKIYRDLSLPIGAVNKKRFDMLYKSFKSSSSQITSFLYSSWLICPLSLYVWLVRLEPFTTNHVKIQGGKFDVEQRIFHSIQAAYELCTHDNNDFRELIPEFYFQPEFLLNLNKFNLGESSDVILPNWAKNPFDFIYKHRKSLESDFVSKNLHKWIDLTFGCKQKSEEDKNIYRNELYSNVWETEFGKDPKNAEQIRCSLDLLGQIPQPLFGSPHPEKRVISKEEKAKKCEDKWPSNEFTFSIEKDLNSFYLSQNRAAYENRELFVVYSIVNKQNEFENNAVKFYLYLYVLEFVVIKDDENRKKFISLTHLLKYEMKPNSIDFISSSLLLIESIESNSDSLSIVSNNVKNVSQFGIILTFGSSIYLSFNLLSNNDNSHKKFVLKNEIGCTFEKVAVGELYLAAVNSDSNTLHVFERKLKNEVESSFKIDLNDYIEDSINCIALSDTFHLCVCGTKSSSKIILVSINKKEVERTVELNKDCEIPVKIIITPSWGFIIVLTKVPVNENKVDDVDCNSKYRLRLFNVNGYFISKSELFSFDVSQSSIKKVSKNVEDGSSIDSLVDFHLNEVFKCRKKEALKFVCWTSKSGFDFVLMADLHSVYLFEVFNCSDAPGNPILTFTNEIIGLDFIDDAEKVVVTLDDGKVIVSSINK